MTTFEIKRSSSANSPRRRRRVAVSNNVVSSVDVGSASTAFLLDMFIATEPSAVNNDGDGQGIDIYTTEQPVMIQAVSGDHKARLDSSMQGLLASSKITLSEEITQIISFELSEETSERLVITNVELVPRPGTNFMQAEQRESLYKVEISPDEATLLLSPNMFDVPKTSWRDMGSSGDWPIEEGTWRLQVIITAYDEKGWRYTGSYDIEYRLPD